MDAKQEFTLYWMKIGRRVWLGPGKEKYLEECDRDIKEVEDWIARGNPGVPPRFCGTLSLPKPVDHESLDGLKCQRCGIEKIYWQHFPDCSRFKPSWDVVRTAFKPPSDEKDRGAFRWTSTTKKDWEEKRQKINPRPDIP
jgi:hypothetical protein